MYVEIMHCAITLHAMVFCFVFVFFKGLGKDTEKKANVDNKNNR